MNNPASDLPGEKSHRLRDLLSDTGSEIAHVVGGERYGASVYKDEGQVVRYYDPTSELSDLIYEF